MAAASQVPMSTAYVATLLISSAARTGPVDRATREISSDNQGSMSMDITLEAPAERDLAGFAEYSRASIDGIGRAVAVAISDESVATGALTAALTSARTNWGDHDVSTDPDRYVYAHAINHVIGLRSTADSAETHPRPLLGPACTVAYFQLEWTIDEISAALQLSPEAVERHLNLARDNGIAHRPTTSMHFDVRSQVRGLIANEPPPVVDIRRIDRRYRWGLRRKTLKRAGVILALAIGVLAVLAQLVARPERVAADLPEVPVPAITPNTIERAPAGASSAAGAGAVGDVPQPDLVPRPGLITTDGQGGFVGVRSPSPQNALALISRSGDAQNWSLVNRWDPGRGASIGRFERSGESYIAWLSRPGLASDNAVGTVAISQDLVEWTEITLALEDPAPNGLIYKREIASVSVSGDSILALVTTSIEIDFAALSLSEGYTCGQTITQDEVSVKLCNDAELDVLSLSDIETLPDQGRLFFSQSGRAFAPIDIPFEDQSISELTTVNGNFAVADEIGLRVALSTDAQTWTIVTAGQPAFPVRSAAINDRGQAVGIGDIDGTFVLFHNDGQAPNTTVIALTELLGEVRPGTRARVASSTNRWAVYVYEPLTRAWLLSSRNGTDWQVTPTSPPTTNDPRLLVGDNEVLVQWVDSDDQIITLGVPLP